LLEVYPLSKAFNTHIFLLNFFSFLQQGKQLVIQKQGVKNKESPYIYILLGSITYTGMEGVNYNTNEDSPLSIIKDSHLKLSLPSSSSPSLSSVSQSLKIAIWRDERLDYLDIPKGLVEILQINGFTVEMILEHGPSQIAEKLGIDDYIAQIIFNETTKEIINFNK